MRRYSAGPLRAGLSPCSSADLVPPSQAGFTYIGVLILVFIMGILLAATGEVWHTVQQREKERELLFVGNEFRKAIGRYYELAPGGAKKFPSKLEDLLLDERYQTTQRYLRKIYPDPFSAKPEWGLLKAPDEGIMGVYSLSDEAPLQVANFEGENLDFTDAIHYSDWRFVYRPGSIAGPSTSTPAVPIPLVR
jgi:type II secretory pathway pseudopilin PulG